MLQTVNMYIIKQNKLYFTVWETLKRETKWVFRFQKLHHYESIDKPLESESSVFLRSNSKFLTRLTQRVPIVEQELVTLPKHLSSPLVFNEVRVTRSLALCVCFVYHCLSFLHFSLGHYVVCSSSLGHCVVCSSFLGHCVFCSSSLGHYVVCSSLGHYVVCSSSLGHYVVCSSSFGHYVVCSSSIYGFWLPLDIFKLILNELSLLSICLNHKILHWF